MFKGRFVRISARLCSIPYTFVLIIRNHEVPKSGGLEVTSQECPLLSEIRIRGLRSLIEEIPRRLVWIKVY